MRSVRARVEALESRLRQSERQSFIFPSLDALRAAGATSGLVVGLVLPMDEWCRLAAQQQAELTRGNHATE